jgi:DNA-binding NtrC family response regulator
LNPAALVGAGQLRADLWLRLCVARIRVPALAERIEDIEELAQLILKRLPRAERTALKLSPEGLMVLRRRPWPGNIRELESVLERASLLSDSGEIGPDSLDDPLGGNGLQDVMPKWGETTDSAVSVDGKTRRELARALGISERTLYRRLRERRDSGNGEIL